MALQYNPLDNDFTVFESVENPTVSFKMPLMSTPIDLSDNFYKINEENIPMAKLNENILVNFNSSNLEPLQIQTTNSKDSNSNNLYINSDKNKEYAMNFFMNKGLSLLASAGIVGNLILESNLNPEAIGDKGTSYGIAQWRDPLKGKGRWTNLKKFAEKNGTSYKDLNTQLEFLWHELNTDYKGTLNKLNLSSDYKQATTVFMTNFEKPSLKYANLELRIKNAGTLLETSK